MDNKNIFAKNLKKYMTLNNKSRKDVCNDLGFSYYTLSDWVNGKKYPRMDKVEILANYFGIKKSDLIEDKSKTKNNIKSLRQERSISLYELANEIHIDVDLLQKYENGTEKVPLETLEKISNFFNVSVDEITTLGLITSDQTTLITSNVRIAKMQKKWFDKVGTVNFSDEELDKIIEYALFLISQRKE